MTAFRSTLERIGALETPDSFIVATQLDAQTIGSTFTKATDLVLGPQNFNIKKGPDLAINDAGDGIDVIRAGRYALWFNCQLVSVTDDGWFEPAIEPNGLDLSSELWPGDITVGHTGLYVPSAIFNYVPAATPGAHVGYTAPKLAAGAVVTGWAKYNSSTDATCDIRAVLFATRITT